MKYSSNCLYYCCALAKIIFELNRQIRKSSDLLKAYDGNINLSPKNEQIN